MTFSTNEQHTAFLQSLLAAKKSFGPVLKDKNNPAFKSKYADLGAVLDAVEGPLLDNDIIISQSFKWEQGDDYMTLMTQLLHVDGGGSVSTYRLKPSKDDPQGEGSAATYGRRYSLLAMLSIAPEDDDGNAAANREQPKRDWIAEAKKMKSIDGLKELGRLAASRNEFNGDVEKFIREAVAKLEAEQSPVVSDPTEA